MKRLATSMACAALAVSALTACGGGKSSGPDGDYCKAVKSARDKISSVSGSTDKASMKTAQKSIDKVTSNAPSSIKDDWQVLQDVVKALVTGDTAKVQSEAAKIQTASQKIAKQVKKECKFDMNKSS